MFTYISFLVSQNNICKINKIPKTKLTFQWFLYTVWYSICRLGLIDTFKLSYKNTGKTAIWCILTIFKHWGIIVKLHFLHIFGISDWNHKDFKCIYILCFRIPLIDCLIEIRFTCANFFSIQSKSRSTNAVILQI